MTHNKQRNTVVYRKHVKNGTSKLVSVRLTPAASAALEAIKNQFAQAYPADKYPSVSLCFEKALINYASEIKFDSKTLFAVLSEMQAAGYPVNKARVANPDA